MREEKEKLSLAWKKRALFLKSYQLSKKKKALDAFAFMPIEKITTKEVQIRLQVGYHLALKIKEWLVAIK